MTDSPDSSAKPAGRGRQGRSYLMNLLDSNGLSPRRQLGQNFLVDLNLMDLLIRSAEIGPDDVILEVGAGTGGLTNRIGQAAGRVLSVEKDEGFFRLASAETRGLDRVTIIAGDALAGKHRINPEVIERLTAAITERGADGYSLVANLPYDISTSLISNLLLLDSPPIKRLTVTVQKEMGDRLLATPGVKDYGPISALVRAVGVPQLVRLLPPDAFWPKPKVNSSIVRVDVLPRDQWLVPRAELGGWHGFVRQLFLHRRKNLRAGLRSYPAWKAAGTAVDEWIAAAGLSAERRTEQLAPDELRALWVAAGKPRLDDVGNDSDDA